MTSTLYLLFNGESDVCWSFHRQVLEGLLARHPDCFLLPHVKELVLDESLAQRLREQERDVQGSLDAHVSFSRVPESYFEARRRFIANPPDWKKADGFRVFVIFTADGRAVWSPSGNNLNGFYEHNPSRFLCRALRVDLSEEEEVRIDGYFEWAADNF
jgi:hypothetical protein